MFERLVGREPEVLGDRGVSRYAVLLPYLPETGELLFEVRSHKLGRQPGEICFPGGRLEAGETPAQAALRETREELLVDRDMISLIAPLDILLRPEELVVYPFLAELRGYHGGFQTAEVEEVFAVPFAFFLEQEPEVHYNAATIVPEDPERMRQLLGVDQYPWRTSRYPVHFYRYGQRMIWGMTARFVHNLVTLCRA